jgi:hypothetical protein
MALVKDEEAWQKIKEYKYPRDAFLRNAEITPGFVLQLAMEEYLLSELKVLVMSRLNMADEMAEEINALLDYEDVSHVLFTEIPLLYAGLMNSLICAQMVKGDLASAQKNIIQCRDYMNKHFDPIKGISGPVSFGLQHYFHCLESLNEYEYYINNLTETHFFVS